MSTERAIEIVEKILAGLAFGLIVTGIGLLIAVGLSGCEKAPPQETASGNGICELVFLQKGHVYVASTLGYYAHNVVTRVREPSDAKWHRTFVETSVGGSKCYEFVEVP